MKQVNIISKIKVLQRVNTCLFAINVMPLILFWILILSRTR
jgi:hypothetical protein